jgi:hypothetical protein
MAEFHLIWTEQAKAAADLRVKQYHIVRLSAKDTVNQASEAAAPSNWGVLQNKPNTNEHATVGLLGVTKLVVGSAVTVNALLTTSASGRAVNAATSGDYVLARALEAASTDGEVITAEVFRPWYRVGV